MAKSRSIQTNFASGELSPLLKGRTDLDQYYQGVETADNVLIVPQGGLKKRGGTENLGSVIPSLQQLTGSKTSTMGTVTSAIDDNDPETYVTLGAIGVNITHVFCRYDLGLARTPEIIDIQNIYTSIQNPNNEDITMKVQYSTNGTTGWSNFQGSTFTINNNKKSLRIRVPYQFSPAGTYNKRFWRLVVENTHGTASGAYIRCGQFQLFRKETAVGSGLPVFGDVKLHEFSIAEDKHYLCVLTAGNLALYRIPHAGSTDTTLVADVWTPYTSPQMKDVRVVSYENVILLFHEEHAPRRIIKNKDSDASDSCITDPIPFIHVPQFDYNDELSPTAVSAVQTIKYGSSAKIGDQYQVDVDGVLSKNTSYAGSSTTDEQAATAENLRRHLQEMPVFGDTGISVSFTSGTTYEITMADDSANSYELFSGYFTTGAVTHEITFTSTTVGTSRKEDIWSATRGYPRMGAFHAGRLWFGGTKSKPQSLFASSAGSFFNFEIRGGEDDEAIFVTIASDKLTEIQNLVSDRALQVFCVGAEFIVKGNTPATVDVVSQTQHGSLKIQPQAMDGATLFLDRNGKTLRQFLFSFNEDAYTSNDLSVLSSHLIKNPVDMAALSGTATEDSNWVYIVNDDGTMAVLNTLRSQDINGFTKHTQSASGTESPYCNTLARHFAPLAGDAVYLTVETISANSIKVSVTSADSTPVDGLEIPFTDPEFDTYGNIVVDGGTYSRTLTWNTPPTNANEFNVLWSKQGFGGFWQLRDPNDLFSFPFGAACSLGTGQTDTFIERVCTVNNELYLIYKREIQNDIVRSLCRYSFDHNLDFSLKYTNVNTTSLGLTVDNITGLVVTPIADGVVLPSKTVQTSPTIPFYITFSQNELPIDNLEFGFSIDATIKPMPVNSSMGSGQNVMREKKITRMNMRVHETAKMRVEGIEAGILEDGNPDAGEQTDRTPRNGIIQDNNGGIGWGIDVAPTITNTDNTPMHIQAIEYEIESS